jgi:hypothetical protein
MEDDTESLMATTAPQKRGRGAPEKTPRRALPSLMAAPPFPRRPLDSGVCSKIDGLLSKSFDTAAEERALLLTIFAHIGGASSKATCAANRALYEWQRNYPAVDEDDGPRAPLPSDGPHQHRGHRATAVLNFVAYLRATVDDLPCGFAQAPFQLFWDFEQAGHTRAARPVVLECCREGTRGSVLVTVYDKWSAKRHTMPLSVFAAAVAC